MKSMKILRACLLILFPVVLMMSSALAEQKTSTFFEEDAIISAQHLMTEVYSCDEEIANAFRYIAETNETGIEVRVYPFPELGDCFVVMYKKDGTLLNSQMPDILDFSSYSKQVRETHYTFTMYTLEERAAYSEEYIPKVEARLRIEPDYNGIHFHYTRSRYGIPTEYDIPQEQALELAKKALINNQYVDSNWFENYWYQVYFDITDPENSLWKFYFGSSIAGKGKYVVRLNSKSGEIVRMFKRTGSMPLWEMY